MIILHMQLELTMKANLPFFLPFSSFLKIVLEICVDISQQNNFIAIRLLAAGSSTAISVPVLVKSNVVIWGEE